MADLSPSWICLLVNHNFLRRRGVSVEQEMRSAFGVDFIDFAMTLDGSEETYAFVKCLDYHSHVDRLRHSPAIKTVLTTFDSPCFLSDTEVKDFVKSALPIEEPKEFGAGDLVRVKNGFLSNLVGIVVRRIKKKKRRYLVVFRFHIRKFRECLSAKDLTLVGNIFTLVRSPVSSPAKARRRSRRLVSCPRRLEKRRNEHRRHRTTHRKCKARRGR